MADNHEDKRIVSFETEFDRELATNSNNKKQQVMKTKLSVLLLYLCSLTLFAACSNNRQKQKTPAENVATSIRNFLNTNSNRMTCEEKFQVNVDLYNEFKLYSFDSAFHYATRYAADKSWHADILRLHTSRKYKERWNNRMVLSLLFIGFIVIKFYKCTDKKDKQIKYPCLFAQIVIL